MKAGSFDNCKICYNNVIGFMAVLSLSINGQSGSFDHDKICEEIRINHRFAVVC